jgi:hypothetical protein
MLYHLLPDNLAVILKEESIMPFRLVCKGLKAQIERFPEFVLRLSKDGTENMTSNFLLRFKGKIVIGSRYGWCLGNGWFRAMIDAIQLGLIVTMIETLEVDSVSIGLLSESLALAMSRRERVHGSADKVAHISLKLTTSHSKLKECLVPIETLGKVCTNISIKISLYYFKERDSMQKIVSNVNDVHSSCMIEELGFR